MSNYTRTHKRLSGLYDVASVPDVVGSRSGEWVTALDSAEGTSDDDYTLAGSSVAALTQSGVLYADQIPGVYGGQSHVITGEMRADGNFYATGSSTPVVPEIGTIYLDIVTYDHVAVAYRWLHTANKYVACPNNFRFVAGAGLKLTVDDDGSHKSADISVAVSGDTVSANSGPDPDDASKPSLPDVDPTTGLVSNKSLGFDRNGNLVHRAQDLLATKGSDELRVGASQSTDPGFGGTVNTGWVKAYGHIVDMSSTNVTFPSNKCNTTKAGICIIDTASDIGSEASPGTANGKVSALDHVHAAKTLTFTGESSGRDLHSYSLGGEQVIFNLSSFLKVAPPQSGPTSAGEVFRTSENSVERGGWGSIVGNNPTGFVAYNQTTSSSTYYGYMQNIFKVGDGYTVDGAEYTVVSGETEFYGGCILLDPSSVYMVTGQFYAIGKSNRECDTYDNIGIALNVGFPVYNGLSPMTDYSKSLVCTVSVDYSIAHAGVANYAKPYSFSGLLNTGLSDEIYTVDGKDYSPVWGSFAPFNRSERLVEHQGNISNLRFKKIK